MASSQTRLVTALNSRYSEAAGDDNCRMYVILASAIIRRPVSEECHHPRCTRLERFMRQAWGRRFAPTRRDHSDCPDGNIIERWRIVLRARASLVQSAGLGWSLDSHLTLDWAKKSFERIARRRSVGKNLNTSLVRRGFSKYPYHCLNGAISSVRNCAKARRHYVQEYVAQV